IRYLIVTGVQTCALPISPSRADEGRTLREKERCRKPQGVSWGFFVVAEDFWPGKIHEHTSLSAPPKCSLHCSRCLLVLCGPFARSEERRVGKECRLWWSR